LDTSPFEITTESLDLEANGIGRRDGKVVFVRGALAFERVLARPSRSKPKFDVATTLEVLKPSVSRVQPQCRYFGVCGGCSMQHLDARAQVSVKGRTLEDNLWHLGKVKAQTMLPPIVGSAWRYRYRARLSVRNVHKKGKVLIGFHEKNSSYVADMESCEVLPQRVSNLLLPMRELVASLSICEQLPQIEVAYAQPHEGADVLALALRILQPLSSADRLVLAQFSKQHQVEFWLQTKGPETLALLDPTNASRLEYYLAEYNVRMPFKPNDFTQVNHQINTVLVRRALRLLDVQSHETVLDLFCGLGNFTLPLARLANKVMGIEGSATLVARARDNALLNGLDQKTQFGVSNLFEFSVQALAKLGDFARADKWLIDPPREGALAICEALAALSLSDPQAVPKRIVYVSCNPATLARDCAMLVHSAGWVVRSAGVVNMFAHTSHVESIVVLERPHP
jgi:23S rRNA (uracil1939-C5)-methyltransferase